MDKEIGKVVHYFDKAMVAVVKLTDSIAVGDEVKFIYGEKECTQRIESMEVNHQKVESGETGDEVAIKVNEATHEGAKVYKITE